jgi:hypothetical protein
MNTKKSPTIMVGGDPTRLTLEEIHTKQFFDITMHEQTMYSIQPRLTQVNIKVYN